MSQGLTGDRTSRNILVEEWKFSYVRIHWPQIWVGVALLTMGLAVVAAEWMMEGTVASTLLPGALFSIPGLLAIYERLGVAVSQDGKRVFSWYGFKVPLITTLKLKRSLRPVSDFRCIQISTERNYYVLHLRGAKDIFVHGCWSRDELAPISKDLAEATGLPIQDVKKW
jgi:hypothetical protein